MFQNNNQYDELINKAGKTTGIDPQNLKQTIDSGKLDDLLKKMNPADAARFKEIISDPQKADAMLNTPQAKMLIKRFMK